MKITITTKEQFVKAQIEEWGFEYVEELFASGYEPCIMDGRWCWYVLQRTHISHSNASNSSSRNLDHSRHNLGLVLRS